MRKSTIDWILNPVSKFIHLEYTAGIVLLGAVLAAIGWVNIFGVESYHHFWDTKLGISLGSYVLNQPLHVWINDGLMAVFFFVIGLELKREFIDGELSTFRKAVLPMTAAIGGMLVPALIYFGFNHQPPAVNGWGIPMATDIAFALGLLSLAGNHIPNSVKVFLSALAVADDLGAVIVIAVFYSAHISFGLLALGTGLLGLLWLGNILGVRHVLFYSILGIAVWLTFLFSGVHATIAGVLIALTIPSRTKIDENDYMNQLRKFARRFEEQIPTNSSLTTPTQHRIIEKIRKLSQDAETPLQKIEYSLHPWVAFVIMPVFALANAGIPVHNGFLASLGNNVSMGIILGLVFGKFIGILGFTWMMVKWGPASLPEQSNWRMIVGIAFLGGVGFTMSLFITELAFNDKLLIESAKAGILVASLIAGALGLIILRMQKRRVGA